MNIGLSSGQFDLVTHVCGSMAALCEGEVLQSECAEKHTMTRQAYLDIIYKKTACLIGVSASAGAMAVGAPREKVALMRRFGEAIGMAFQIQDDILDYMRTAHTGKPANNDLREGKITLPLLAVLDKATPERRAELSAAGRLPRGGGIGGVFAEYGRERGRAGFCRRSDAQLRSAGRRDALRIRALGVPYGAR